MAEWSVDLSDADLALSLQAALRAEQDREQRTKSPFVTAFLVDRWKGMKFDVFADEHPPPHFRVQTSGDSATYYLSDGTPYQGSLGHRYDRAVKEWHTQNKAAVIKRWNDARPTDCPVGEYREDAV